MRQPRSVGTRAPVLLVALLVAAGCAARTATLTREQLARAPIGPPPTQYETRVRDYFARHLRDPGSAIYSLSPPVRGWEDDRVVWAVCGTVNARNAFGWYAGPRPFVAFFEGDALRGMIDRYRTTDSPFVRACEAWHALGVYE